jgi:hypothetical protein
VHRHSLFGYRIKLSKITSRFHFCFQFSLKVSRTISSACVNYTVIYPCCQPLFVVLIKYFYLFTTTAISNYAIIVRSFPLRVKCFCIFFWILFQSAFDATPVGVVIPQRVQRTTTTPTLRVSNHHCHNCIVFIYMRQPVVLLFCHRSKITYCTQQSFCHISSRAPV